MTFDATRPRGAFVLLVMALFVSESRGDAFRWIGTPPTGGGLYSLSTNWQRLTDTGTPIPGGGPPEPGRQVLYQVNGTYTVDVDTSATHGPTSFAANNANTTLNITGPGYAIPSQVKVGSVAGTTNHLTVSGSGFTASTLEIAPTLGTASFTLSAPMQSNIVVVSGQPNAVPGGETQTAGGMATLTLNPGADLTTTSLLAYNVGAGTSIVFNGGSLTIRGRGLFHNPAATTFAQVGDGTSAAVLNLEGYPFVAAVPPQFSFRATDTLTINTNATVNYNAPGGFLTVGDIHRLTSASPAGVFNWVAGQIELLNASLSVSPTGQLGANLNLNTDRRLTVAGGTTIASGSSLTLSGGSLTTESLTNSGGSFTYSSGGLFLQSGGLAIGGGGVTNPSSVVLNVNDSIALPGVLNIDSGRSVDVNGGYLAVGGTAGGGTLNYHSGFLEIASGDLNLDNTTLTETDLVSVSGDLTIATGQTVTLDGGSLTVGRKAGGGQVEYLTGNLTVTTGDLSVGPTGDINNPVTIDSASSIQALAGTLTIQPTQTFNVDGGYVVAKSAAIHSNVSVSNGTFAATKISLGGAGGAGQMTVGPDAGVFFAIVLPNHLIVDGGVVQGSYDPPQPGEENPSIDNSIALGYNQDGRLTIHDGYVSAPNVRIGITPGFVGTATINGGTLTTDNLVAARGAESIVHFNGGTINTAHSEIDGTAAFIVGNGTSEATLNLTGDGTHSFADGLTISANAQLTGTGTITGNVTSSGTISPGESGAGLLAVTGALATTGTLAFDIEAADFFDRLNVSGNVSASGTMAVTMPTYVPAAGETFDLMDFAGLTNNGYTFDFTNAPLPAGLIWNTSQFAAAGEINVAFAGDFNLDGAVNAADYVIWRKGLGTSFTQGDYDTWRAQFGQTSPGSGAMTGAAVPEPAAALLLLIFAVSQVYPHVWCMRS